MVTVKQFSVLFIILVWIPLSQFRTTFQLIGGIPCKNITSDIVEDEDRVSIGTCAMSCGQKGMCGGFVFNSIQEISATSPQRRCHLVSLCQLQRWLHESPPRWPPESSDCLVRASLSRDRFRQLSSGLSSHLVNATVIYANFRDSDVATANYRNVCRPELGSLMNVKLVPAVGLQFAGNTNSFVNIDTSPFAEIVLKELTIFLRASRTLTDISSTGAHYVWGAQCDGLNELLILREYQGYLSFLFRGGNSAVDWRMALPPSEVSVSHDVTIGMSTDFVTTNLYYNGTLMRATVVSNASVSVTLSADTMKCLFLGRTPYNSMRCLNGTLVCFHMLSVATNATEMLQLAKFCDDSHQPPGDSCPAVGT